MLKRMALAAVAFLVVALGLVPDPAHASVIQAVEGFSSLGTPVSFKAKLTIAENTLTVVLSNASTVTSSAPSDLLSSYYFDIINSASVRPTLTYVSASGNVWLTDKAAADVLQTANANLKVAIISAGPPEKWDGKWDFKPMDATLFPNLGFGVGTVGNNSSPFSIPPENGFNGKEVDGLDYSIYAGDVTTQNLDDTLLVKGPITFTFSGVSGFSESDISSQFVFGLGTAPASLMTPEPATLALLAVGLGAIGMKRRRR